MTASQAALFVSRLQGMTAVHEAGIRAALEAAPVAAALILRSDVAVSIMDPFTFDERVEMLRSAFAQEMDSGRLVVVPVPDRGYDDEALAEAAGRSFASLTGLPADSQCTAFFDGPETSARGEVGLHATRLRTFEPAASREASRAACSGLPLGDGFSDEAAGFIGRWRQQDGFEALREECASATAVNERYGHGPFGTGDAVCIADSHVLLIRRANAPFKGMLALPGGIVDAGEEGRAAAVRELLEETGVGSEGATLTPERLESLIDDPEGATVDDPWRDPRGRYVSHAYVFRMPGTPSDYTATGSDDATSAEWHPLASLSPSGLAFDHFAVMNRVAGLPYPLESGIMPEGGPKP